VVASLKKVDPVVLHAIDDPMLLSNPPRPTTVQQVTQRLGLSYTLE
jgi:hypothetical protein